MTSHRSARLRQKRPRVSSMHVLYGNTATGQSTRFLVLILCPAPCSPLHGMMLLCDTSVQIPDCSQLHCCAAGTCAAGLPTVCNRPIDANHPNTERLHTLCVQKRPLTCQTTRPRNLPKPRRKHQSHKDCSSQTSSPGEAAAKARSQQQPQQQHPQRAYRLTALIKAETGKAPQSVNIRKGLGYDTQRGRSAACRLVILPSAS
jgi:hypothetical protein